MNSKKAKKLRKQVFGDFSSHPEGTRYRFDKDVGGIVTTGRRKKYQQLKKEGKHGR